MNPINAKKFEYLISRLKIEHNLSYTELATEMGVSKSAVSAFKIRGVPSSRVRQLHLLLESRQSIHYLDDYEKDNFSTSGLAPLINKNEHDLFARDPEFTSQHNVRSEGAEVVIVVQGDAMKGLLEDGDRVYCKSIKRTMWHRIEPNRAHVIVSGNVLVRNIEATSKSIKLIANNIAFDDVTLQPKEIEAIYYITHIFTAYRN